MMKKIPEIKVSTEYYRLDGGLDLESPALSIYPGSSIVANNYEANALGGYSRIDGYECFDGHPSPSDAAYTMLYVTLTASVAINDVITGNTSGATGVLIFIPDANRIAVTKVTGTFVNGETIKVSGSPVGTITNDPATNGLDESDLNSQALSLSADAYRSAISKPPGSGAILGIVVLNGVVYCFRNNAGGTAAAIYKSSASGWVNVPLYSSISFNAGNANIADGTAITQLVSGATATVKRQVIESGTVGSSTATGRLILSNITGTFDATHGIQVGGVTKCTATSLVSAITIQPNGRYEFNVYNFYGNSTTLRIYGCDGVNKGFEFDGDVYVPLTTGQPVDAPVHVCCHKKMLFFSFGAMLDNSGIGLPYQWNSGTGVGASEIGFGDTITALTELPGDALAVVTRNNTYQLAGSSTANFVNTIISSTTGAIPYGFATSDLTYLLDDRGIIKLTPTQAYGNFDKETISRKVQDLIAGLKRKFRCAATYKTKNQIRFYGNDGTGVIMTIAQKADAATVSVSASSSRVAEEHRFTNLTYPFTVNCAFSGENANGDDLVFLGSSDGWVYQCNKGCSFDGQKITATLMLPFNINKSPTILKQYRKAIIELTSSSYSSIYIHPEFSYGDPSISTHEFSIANVGGVGALWDGSYFDSIYHYDSKIVSQPEIHLTGHGTNISIVIHSDSTIDFGHRIDGILLHYTQRRLVR